MKKVLLLFILFVSFQGYSQKDSIVNYLGYKNKILDKIDNAYKVEVITKESDSLWLRRLFHRNGKLSSLRYYTNANKNKENRIGQHVVFDKNDSIKSIAYYNRKGLKHGKFQSWFDNRNISLKGVFVNDKKQGLWSAYHYNGKLAARSVFKDDLLVKKQYYNIEGTKTVKNDKSLKFKKPVFKGGIKKFTKKLQQLTKKITYKIKGRIYINFTVDIDGNVKNVKIYNKIPLKLKKQLICFFVKIEGWQPASHLNRNIPYNYTIPLKF